MNKDQTPKEITKGSPGDDDYSSDKSSDDDDMRFMDINDLKNRQAKTGTGKDKESPAKSTKSKVQGADDDNYEEDDFI